MEGRPLLQTPAVITCSVAFHVTQRSASNIDDVAVAVGGVVSARAGVSGRGSGRASARAGGSASASRTGEGSDNDGRDGD